MVLPSQMILMKHTKTQRIYILWLNLWFFPLKMIDGADDIGFQWPEMP